MKITFCMLDRNYQQLASNVRRSIPLSLLCLLGFPCVGHTDLIDTGNGLIIDTDRNVMWLQDLNYAATIGFDSDGLMSFESAQAFIDAMNRGVVPNFGFTDWRLPTTPIPDSTCDTLPEKGIGFYCSGSEMGHLYYTELDLLDHQNGTETSHLPFFNLYGVYWSGTEITPGSSAMVFGLLGGNQFSGSAKLAEAAVLPVRANVDAAESGYLHFDAHIRGKPSRLVRIRYDFAFALPAGSDGVFPATEVVEIEVAGELKPDGSEGAIFVISIPIGSFWEAQSGFFYTWNTPRLSVSQYSESYVWDFLPSHTWMGRSDSVKGFWAFIRPPVADKVGNMRIWMSIRDNRSDTEPTEPAPKFFDLLFGNPTLRIGETEWESQVEQLWFSSDRNKLLTYE